MICFNVLKVELFSILAQTSGVSIVVSSASQCHRLSAGVRCGLQANHLPSFTMKPCCCNTRRASLFGTNLTDAVFLNCARASLCFSELKDMTFLTANN